MDRKITIPFFLLFLGIYSCNKNSPPDYPSVQISSPYSLATFNVPGTIQVTGHASDSKSLTSISVYIANSQNQPVEQSILVPVTSNSMNISLTYELNDIHMAGGEYYMTITASNGTNIASAFQQIYIDALPTKRTAIYAITRSSAGINAWKINSAFQDSLSFTVSGDYSSSDINTYYQQLYIAARDSGNVNVYSVPNPAELEWNIPGSPNPNPYFTNIYCNNDGEYLSYFTLDYVKCFNHSGQLQATYNTYAGYYPIKTFLWDNLVFIEEKSISSSAENLWAYYQGSGPKQQMPLPAGPMVAMCGYDNNDIFLFGNNSTGGAYMVLYSISANNYFSPITLAPYGQLLSVAQVNSNTYLMGFSDGIIYQYTYNPNSITPYINGVTASHVRYDSINNQVITASGKMVSEYNYGISSGTFITSVMLPDSVMDVRILFNK
jgi:hypothetical protein